MGDADHQKPASGAASPAAHRLTAEFREPPAAPPKPGRIGVLSFSQVHDLDA